MKELAGPVTNRARLADDMLGRALVEQARKVARLTERRRKLRRTLRELEHELTTSRKFLRGLATDRAERTSPTRPDELLPGERAECFEPVPDHGQSLCTRPAGHRGAHRCSAADVDARGKA